MHIAVTVTLIAIFAITLSSCGWTVIKIIFASTKRPENVVLLYQKLCIVSVIFTVLVSF